jgi:hypothetical protein
MLELCGDEERVSVLLGHDHFYGNVTNDLVARIDGAHLYCDLTATDKQLEIRYDGETSESWPLQEVLSAGIRAIRGEG